MREIVTLQLGQLSNYTATHFWNAQVFNYSIPKLDVLQLTRSGILLYIL